MDQRAALLACTPDFLPLLSSLVQIYLVNISYFQLMIGTGGKFPAQLGPNYENYEF